MEGSKGLRIRELSTGHYFWMRDGKCYDSDGHLYEFLDGRLSRVVDQSRLGWWRFHEHYDRDGYCDSPARGY